MRHLPGRPHIWRKPAWRVPRRAFLRLMPRLRSVADATLVFYLRAARRRVVQNPVWQKVLHGFSTHVWPALSNRLLPTLLLVLLGGLAYLLNRATDFVRLSPAVGPNSKSLVLSGTQLSYFDETGAIAYTVSASEMNYTLAREASFRDVALTSLQTVDARPGDIRSKQRIPPLQVNARQAYLREGEEAIFFQDDVLLTTLPQTATTVPAAAGKHAAVSPTAGATHLPGLLTLRTSQLQLDLKKQTARTDAPVEMDADGDRVRSTGFVYNHKQGTLILTQQVSIDWKAPQRAAAPHNTKKQRKRPPQ